MAHIFELCYLETCKKKQAPNQWIGILQESVELMYPRFPQKENSNAGAYKKIKEDKIVFHLKVFA